MALGDGLKACEEAFERLFQGRSLVAENVGIDTKNITTSMVCIEAGYVKGFLKKSRTAHMPLIARIINNQYREE